jgi:NDP-sugar pyrophosphorylase family protein
MKAMILAAGEGTRLRPLTDAAPKPMLEVGGRPLIAHLIDLLRSYGVRDIAINLHHKPEVLRAYLGDGSRFGVRITYSGEDVLLGSAGAVKKLEHLFDDSFFVLYGDVLTDIDLSALAAFHRDQAACVTIALYQAEDPARCGIVEIDGDCRVRRFLEKPQPQEVFSKWASAGIYVVEPDILPLIPAGSFFDFGADLIPILLREGLPVRGYVSLSYFLDIGSWERYRQAQHDLTAGFVKISSLSTATEGQRPEQLVRR